MVRVAWADIHQVLRQGKPAANPQGKNRAFLSKVMLNFPKICIKTYVFLLLALTAARGCGHAASLRESRVVTRAGCAETVRRCAARLPPPLYVSVFACR